MSQWRAALAKGDAMSWMSKILIGLGGFFLVLPFLLYIHGTLQTWAASDWPVAQGRVASARVESSTSTDSDGDTTTSYDVVVAYDYSVGGRRYRNERLWLNDHALFSEPEDAEAELRTYPVGSPIEVTYNPENPQDSVIYTDGPSLWIFLIAIFGFAFAGAGYLLHRIDRPLRRGPSLRFNRAKR